MDPQLEALRERADLNLIAFLRAELDLGFTFTQTAKIETVVDQAGIQRARELAEQALETVYQFQAGLPILKNGERFMTAPVNLKNLYPQCPKKIQSSPLPELSLEGPGPFLRPFP